MKTATKPTDRHFLAAEGSSWLLPGYAQGQIVSEYVIQGPSRYEGVRAGCPKMTAWYDSSDQSWCVSGLEEEARGTGDMPSPSEALALLRGQREARRALNK